MAPISAPFATLLAVAAVVAAGVPAHAQGKLDARYTATLAGVPIGKGTWVIDVAEDQYTAAVSGQTTGLLRVFASGQGTGAARGGVVNGSLVPAAYAATVTADRKSEDLRISLAGGNVRDFSILPEPPPNPDRIPLTDAHKRGVSDPMTASLVRVPGNGDPLTQEACGRTSSVFDGRMRYDLATSFKRVEMVKAEKGYEGPAIVCAVYFMPIAGYIPDRAAIKYLIRQRDMEVWLVPIAGTRILVPYRIAIPTPLGVGAVQATQFISVPYSPRPLPTSARSQ